MAALAGLVLTAPVLSTTFAVTPAAQAADTVSLVPIRQVGAPGHAKLYGWGVAYDPTDNTVLVGDYWNFRVARYNLDGTSAGSDPVTTANKGSANNEDPAPLQHQSPYGLAVDPVDGSFYFGDVDGGKTVDKYTHDGGSAVLAFGGNGTGVGRFQYPSRVAVEPSTRQVYVVDQWQHLISVHDPATGAELRSFGGTGVGPGQFKQPRGAAFDSSGRLFVADNYNSRIQVLDAKSGQMLYAFGGKGTGPGQYSTTADMRGLAIDNANDWVYVADAASGFVNKYTLSGTYLTRFGGYATGPTQFVGGPREIAVDRDGNVWVGDMPGFRVVKFDPDGEYLLQIPSSGGPPPDGGFNQPRGVGVDADGDIFVSDTHNFRMQRFAPDGTFQRAWGHRGGSSLGFNYHRGIAVDRRTGDVVVADTDNHKICKFDGDGNIIWEVGGFGTRPGQFKNPHGVAVGPDGRIYVADTQNQRVQVLDQAGTPLAAFGSKGGADGQFQFNRGVTVDPADGSLWVSDSIRGNVQHFTSSGTFLGKLGAIGTGAGKLERAADVEVIGGYVLVADVDAHQIKIWTKSGTYVTAQGGGGRDLGQLLNPHGMDVAPDGTLYVVEQTGERVQQFKLVIAAPDTVAPSVAISSPAANAVIPSPVTVQATASDDVGVSFAEVAVKDVANGTYLRADGTWGPFTWLAVPVESPGGTTTTFSYKFSAPRDGSYSLQARSTDGANNKSPAVTRPIVVSSDTAPPTATISSPAAGAVVTSPVKLVASGTDNVGVASAEITVRNTTSGAYLRSDGTWGAQQWLPVPVNPVGALSVDFSYEFAAPGDGSFAFAARTIDTSGSRSATVSRAFKVSSDIAAPTVTPTTPKANAVVPGPDITVGGSAADDTAVASVDVAVRNATSGLYLQRDGSWAGTLTWLPAQSTGAGSTSATYSFAFTAPTTGGYSFQSRATDAAGNLSTTKPTRSFTVS